jgi:preprotein translocase subunit SecG
MVWMVVVVVVELVVLLGREKKCGVTTYCDSHAEDVACIHGTK